MAWPSLGVVFGVSLLVGCNHVPVIGKRDPVVTPPAGDRKPDVPSLVAYLNSNARKVQTIKAAVSVDAKQGRQAIGLDGNLACQKPRDFRMKARVLGKDAVDIGSNSDEFWYWISKASPAYVYHCDYKSLATGKVNVPFPFQPDMVMAALGVAEFDPKAKYELKEYPKTLELVQTTTSPTGQAVRRITVFDKHVAKPGKPQVLAHVLTDTKGKLICRASVHRVETHRATGVIVPTRVTIEWPAQEVKMSLSLSDVQVNGIDKAMAGRLFRRADLTNITNYDLAKGVIDGQSSLRRAGAEQPKRR